ncbi:MAG: ankyrin repeat domain-containing protein [Nitrospiraceae bacterium]|nr:ankyrin repeat domain-containing protein [Nitrospiraceae bacterium]
MRLVNAIVMIIIAFVFSSSFACAETNLQKAQNLAACLSGEHPGSCNHEWLTPEEAKEVAAAERRNGNKLLLKAAQHGDIKAATKALECGADANVRNNSGLTPLHLVILSAGLAGQDVYAPMGNQENKWHDLARLLIKKGANVNAKDNQGRTPLHYAAIYNTPGLAMILVNHGADVGIKDQEGKTASQLAAEGGHTNLWNVIQDKKEL